MGVGREGNITDIGLLNWEDQENLAVAIFKETDNDALRKARAKVIAAYDELCSHPNPKSRNTFLVETHHFLSEKTGQQHDSSIKSMSIDELSEKVQEMAGAVYPALKGDKELSGQKADLAENMQVSGGVYTNNAVDIPAGNGGVYTNNAVDFSAGSSGEYTNNAVDLSAGDSQSQAYQSYPAAYGSLELGADPYGRLGPSADNPLPQTPNDVGGGSEELPPLPQTPIDTSDPLPQTPVADGNGSLNPAATDGYGDLNPTAETPDQPGDGYQDLHLAKEKPKREYEVAPDLEEPKRAYEEAPDLEVNGSQAPLSESDYDPTIMGELDKQSLAVQVFKEDVFDDKAMQKARKEALMAYEKSEFDPSKKNDMDFLAKSYQFLMKKNPEMKPMSLRSMSENDISRIVKKIGLETYPDFKDNALSTLTEMVEEKQQQLREMSGLGGVELLKANVAKTKEYLAQLAANAPKTEAVRASSGAQNDQSAGNLGHVANGYQEQPNTYGAVPGAATSRGNDYARYSSRENTEPVMSEREAQQTMSDRRKSMAQTQKEQKEPTVEQEVRAGNAIPGR